MAENDPLEPLRRLVTRVEEEMAKIGLRLEQFASIPGLRGEGDRVQCVFIVDLEELGKDDEQRRYDAEFRKMTDDLQHSDADEEFNRAREQLAEQIRRNREKGGGILGG